MKYLDIPVPETVTACYVVPLPKPMSEKSVRKLIVKAARSRLTAPLATLTVNRLKDGGTEIRALNPGPGAPSVPRPESGVHALLDAAAYAVVSVSDYPSLGAMQELMARATAAALAARFDVPMLNAEAEEVVDPRDAIAALPDASYAQAGNIRISVQLRHWVAFDDTEYEGALWVCSDGMRRFGLPELMMSCGERDDLRPQLTEFLSTVAFRIWSRLVAQTNTEQQDLPDDVRIPAEMTIDGNLVGLSIQEGRGIWLRVWPLFDVDTLSASGEPAVRTG